ncbi:MAG: hypothetical protein K5923_01780 [Clostridia bacterium]|nr:hypothetical protein [Clostridia bacterium]
MAKKEVKEVIYYLINDCIVGKSVIYDRFSKEYIYEDGKWHVDKDWVIMDRIVGFNPNEPPDSPYAFGNDGIMSELKIISKEQAMDVIHKSER